MQLGTLKNSDSLRARWLLLVAFLSYFLILVGVSIWSYNQTKQTLLADIDERLAVAAAGVRYILPEDFHDRAIAADAVSADEDATHIAALSEFARNTDFEFVYTVIEQDGRIIITASSATPEELADGVEVRYFTPFDEADPAFAAAFANQESVAFTHVDRWGEFRAVLRPEISPNGAPYIAAAEHEISYVQNLLNRSLLRTIVSSLILLLGSLPVFYLLVRRQQQNLQLLAETNRQLVTHEKQLEAVNDELQRSNAELERFAYVISHDLQEPLRIITSYLQLLEIQHRPQLTDDALTYMDFAVNGAKRMRAKITGLLAYSRVHSSGTHFEMVDFNAIVDNIIAELDYLLRENQIIITRDELPRLYADRNQMVQLWQNLINNAVKFRRDGEHRVQISARKTDPSPDGSRAAWQFSVVDNGIGISPQHAERIFQMFQRLHAEGEYAGTGIGLAVSKRIVERHDGRIWVESTPDAGATFHFTLPAGNDTGMEDD